MFELPLEALSFPPHSAPNGFDFCRDEAFGLEGDAFVAMFGDLTPVTAQLRTPAGFKIVRVDVAAGLAAAMGWALTRRRHRAR